MSQRGLPDVDARYLYYRFVNELEQGVNVRLGFGLFGAGCAAALVGLAVFAYSITLEAQSATYYAWVQPAYVLGLLSLPLALLGIVVLLPPARSFTGLSALGVLVAVGATVGFALVYPDQWHRAGSDATLHVVGPYALGVGAVAVGVAASMREHAPGIVEAVTRIHWPDDDADDGADGSGDATSAAAASSADAGSGSDDAADSDPDPTVDVGGVPDETAVVDTGDDGEASADDESGPAGTGSGPITLVINGRRYSFGDGDTFGRRDEPWLDDLVAAVGGQEEIPYVSGEHLEFSVEDDGVYVTDTSRNGTSLEGRDISGERARLSDGDRLVLAERATVRVELDR